MTTFSQLIRSITQASFYEVNQTEFNEINHDLEFWKNEADGKSTSSKEVRNKRLIETFNHIISRYLTNNPNQKDSIDYSKYAKYLKETDQSNYLFATIAGKINNQDISVPVLMVQIISFFDRVSKFPPEEQQFFLEQFPMPEEELYNCGPGIGRRLDTVMMQTEDKDIQMINGMVEQETGRLTKFVTNENLIIHIPAMLYNSLCGVSRDANRLTPISYIPAKNIWDFSRNLVKEYNKNIAENAKSAQRLKDVYEKYVKGKTKYKIKKLTFDLGAIGDENFADFVNIFFEGFLARECKLDGNIQGLREKFFNDKDKLILDKNGIPLLELKINELCNSYSIVEEQDDKLTNFNLYDEDAPQKIAEILTSENSTFYQKHLAIQAIWIMSEKFEGNSKVNLVKTLNEIGAKKTNSKDFKERCEAAKNHIKNLSGISESTQYLILQLTSKINDQERIDYVIRGLPIQEIINDQIQNSVSEFINLGCPAEFMNQINFSDEDLISGLLKLAEEDLVRMIFSNPKSEQLLAKLLDCDDKKKIPQIGNIIDLLIKEDLRFGDLKLTKQIIRNHQKIFFKKDLAIKMTENNQDLLSRLDFETNQLIIDSFKEDGFIEYDDAEEIIATPFFENVLRNNKLEVVKYFFSSLRKEDLEKIITDPQFIFDIFYLKSNKIIEVFISELRNSFNFTEEQIADVISKSANDLESNIFHALSRRSNLTLFNFVFEKIKKFKGEIFVKKLILQKNKYNESALMCAVISQNNILAKAIFEKITPEEALEEIKSENISKKSFGLTILHFAIQKDNIEIVNLILQKLGVVVFEENLLKNNNQNLIEKGNQSITKEEDLLRVLGVGKKNNSIIHLLIKSENEDFKKLIDPIISKLSDENLIKILIDQDKKGNPAIYNLILERNFNTLKTVFDRLETDQILRIMKEKGSYDIPIIDFIVQIEDEEMLQFVSSLLIENLKKDQENFSANLLRLFNLRLSGCNPPLYIILLNENISYKTKQEIVMSVIDNLNQRDLLTLLADKNFDQFTFFHPIIDVFDRLKVTLANEFSELILNKLDQAHFLELLDVRDKSGNSLLQLAVSSGNLNMANLILSKLSSFKEQNIKRYCSIKNSSQQTLLHVLARRNDDYNKKLLNKIIDILGSDIQEILKCKDRENFSNTPIHNAALFSNLEAMTAMVEKISGEENVQKIINQTNKSRQTALDIAFQKDSFGVAIYLLKKGGEFNQLILLNNLTKGVDEDDPLFLAEKSTNAFMLLLMLRYDQTVKMINDNRNISQPVKKDLQDMIKYFNARSKSQNITEAPGQISFQQKRFMSAYNKCRKSLEKSEKISNNEPNSATNAKEVSKLDLTNQELRK